MVACSGGLDVVGACFTGCAVYTGPVGARLTGAVTGALVIEGGAV